MMSNRGELFKYEKVIHSILMMMINFGFHDCRGEAFAISASFKSVLWMRAA